MIRRYRRRRHLNRRGMRACTGADGSVTSIQCDANWLDSVCRAGPVNRPDDCLQSRAAVPRDGITNITILL